MSSGRGRPRSEAADRAIQQATLRSLAEQGFSGTTMAGIARDAGVSTATLYRRFDSLSDVIVATLAEQVHSYQVPDTGSLAGDLREYLRYQADRLGDELATRILAALMDASVRDAALADALDAHVWQPRRSELAIMFERAIERGEMRSDLDLELAIDVAAGTLYLRRLAPSRPVDAALADRLTDLLLSGIHRPDGPEG